jgi:hypothetical protein
MLLEVVVYESLLSIHVTPGIVVAINSIHTKIPIILLLIFPSASPLKMGYIGFNILWIHLNVWKR